MPEDAPTKTIVYGTTLLSGLPYCAHCGKKLVGGYCTKQRKSGAYHRPIYRCYNGSVKAKLCDGQAVYSAAKIESAVLDVLHQFFHSLSRTVNNVWPVQARRQLRSRVERQVSTAKANLERLEQQDARLRQEVMRSLMGESCFEPDMLKEMLPKNKAELLALPRWKPRKMLKPPSSAIFLYRFSRSTTGPKNSIPPATTPRR